MAKDNKSKSPTAEEAKAAFDQAFTKLKEAFGFDKVQQEEVSGGAKLVARGMDIKELGDGASIKAEYRKGADESIEIKVLFGDQTAISFNLTDVHGLSSIQGDKNTPLVLTVGNTEAKVNQANDGSLRLWLAGMTPSGGIIEFEPAGLEFAQWLIDSLDKNALQPLPLRIDFPLISKSGSEPDRDPID